jgi:succinate dehydrogenase/fumarate reductase flavoprotein subunit
MNLKQIEMQTDIAVIGGGGAAMRAAFEAAEAGSNVVVISKGRFGFSGSAAIGSSDFGAINIADGYLCKEDSPEEHYNDILNAALGMCNKTLAHTLTVEALKEREFLEGIGVRFNKANDGNYLISKSNFSAIPRSYTTYDQGKSVVRTLKRYAEKNKRVKILENCMVTNIITQGGVCCGVVALSEGLKSVIVVKSKAAVLAAGGGGQLFSLSMNPPDITGDGSALAFRAGAKLANLEFIQFGQGTDNSDYADYCHSFNGGVLINERGETSVEGLYAAGENAAGIFGANRLGGDMLLACQVFGRIAGASAAQYANGAAQIMNKSFAKTEAGRLSSLVGGADPDANEKVENLTNTLKNSNSQRLGVARNEEGIKKALEVIAETEEAVKAIKVSNTRPLIKLLELSNMLTVSKMIAGAANMRKESRGTHNREDYPQINNEWEKNIIIKNVNDNPVFSEGSV